MTEKNVVKQKYSMLILCLLDISVDPTLITYPLMISTEIKP